MIIERIRIRIHAGGFDVPAIIVSPENFRASVAVIHGYGGNKEEMLGLAWRIAEAGFRAVSIDLRGHGEHLLRFDGEIMKDVEAVIAFLRTHGPVAVVGHSLGGRLALHSSADFAIGISPAIRRSFSEQTRKHIRSMRAHRVREVSDHILFDVLERLPEWNASDRAALVVGERDVPEIADGCAELGKKGADLTVIPRALHADIFNQEECFAAVVKHLGERFR